jgi:CTD small phosphatase-like protein 2
VLDRIDPGKLISFRLYRQHTKLKGTVFLKDLTMLGRDISRTIIVDNVAENFQLHPENGIFVRSWFDDMSDHELLDLLPLLTGKV